MSPSTLLRTFNRNSGFTLLEVLAALFILSIAVFGIYQGQSNLVRMTVRSEHMAQALGLAQQKMVETELELRDKSLAGLLDDESGEFKDEAFRDYKWNRKLTRVSAGCLFPSSQGSEEGPENAATPFGDIFSIAEKVFENNVRKIQITVSWKEGNKDRQLSLSQLYVSFKELPSL
jgi:prepilin-type N-terminal cleavage/methylation domain-containing protein